MVFVFLKLFKLPECTRTKPHSLLWNFLLAIDQIYFMFMVYMLLLPTDDARATWRVFDNDLGAPYLMGKSREDCRVFTPDHPEFIMGGIWRNVINIHFVAHLIGWWTKMTIIRDWYLCWICSISWELFEVFGRQF